MKSLNLAIVIAAVLIVSASAQTAKVSPDDMKVIEGSQWMGTLTYLDYGTNKQTSIKSNVTVSRLDSGKLTWTFDYQYPDEPKANSKDEVVLSPDGKTFDGETVIERIKQADGTLKIITTKEGVDNGKKSLYRFTYLAGKNSFSVKKEVRREGSTEYFVRNEYTWKR
jgi:opacity protein-like surface antigen